MRRVIEREDRRMRRRYVRSPRHTIQVDFYPYLRELEHERAAGRRRKERGRGIVPAQSRPGELFAA
jgi:hypothetical protein